MQSLEINISVHIINSTNQSHNVRQFVCIHMCYPVAVFFMFDFTLKNGHNTRVRFFFAPDTWRACGKICDISIPVTHIMLSTLNSPISNMKFKQHAPSTRLSVNCVVAARCRKTRGINHNELYDSYDAGGKPLTSCPPGRPMWLNIQLITSVVTVYFFFQTYDSKHK